MATTTRSSEGHTDEQRRLDTFARQSMALADGAAAGPASVLVVDDEESVRNFVKAVLDSAGYETAVAADGPSAMDVSRAFSFNLLLTDLMMPRMRGDELADQLRKQEPNLKVLYLTGFSQHLFDFRPSLWDHETFLDKPCTVTGLLRAVSQLAGCDPDE